ncbi:hypothetical protein C8J56DRAFT_1027243 [Mycena floridula]|nr:hypothetical protein C8J56DRAFT_1027243 [Mycena floridula]
MSEADLQVILSKLQDANLAMKHECLASSPYSAQSSSTPGLETSVPTATATSPKSYQNPVFLTSAKAFDPALLSLLSAGSGPASDGSKERDHSSGNYFASSYTTIASNPTLFSLTTYFDDVPVVPDSTSSNPRGRQA